MNQNSILFLIKGKMLINSVEYPGVILNEGQFSLQAIGSEVEVKAIEASEYIVYNFDEPAVLCETRFSKIMEYTTVPVTYSPMTMCKPLSLFIEGLSFYLDDNMICGKLLASKSRELAYLLTSYYSLKELSSFYYPILAYRNTFKYFITQNYLKARSVEELASLSGLSVPSFRRMFKATFDEPAYQWMLKQKQKEILSDLENSSLSISEICYKYNFETLSHFSHFCKSNFGKSPRACRADILKSAE